MKKEALRVQVILKNLKKQLVLKRKENENYRRVYGEILSTDIIIYMREQDNDKPTNFVLIMVEKQHILKHTIS